MGKKLEKDEKGRLPLSPMVEDIYQVMKREMGADWLTWPELDRRREKWITQRVIPQDPSSTFRQRVNQMVSRGWMETKKDFYDNTNRKRLHYRIPDGKVMVFCASCEDWCEAKDKLDFLCGDCREYC